MSDAVPIVSVCVTGAVALAVPWISARFGRTSQRQQFAHDRSMRDLQELRDLFDETVHHITVAQEADQELVRKRRTAGLRTAELGGGITVEDFERLLELSRERAAAIHSLLGCQERIAIRIGRDTLVRQHARAVAEALDGLSRMSPNPDEDQDGKVELVREIGRKRREFIDEARKLVGTRLAEGGDESHLRMRFRR